MARNLIRPTVEGNKVNYYLAFDMYPADEQDDVVVPEGPTPDDSDNEDDEIIWDGGNL